MPGLFFLGGGGVRGVGRGRGYDFTTQQKGRRQRGILIQKLGVGSFTGEEAFKAANPAMLFNDMCDSDSRPRSGYEALLHRKKRYVASFIGFPHTMHFRLG